MLYLTTEVRQQIIDDALRTFPDECCGFLLGRDEGSQRFIDQIIRINNAKEGDKRRRFQITPHDYLKTERYAAQNHLDLLGVYHSHPNHPSIPSEHDRVVAQPYFSYVIVSIYEQEFVSIHSWRLDQHSQFAQEPLHQVGDLLSPLAANPVPKPPAS